MTGDVRPVLVGLLEPHEPVLAVTTFGASIVGCSCLSARDYRAAGHKAGQAGFRAHVAEVIASAGVVVATSEVDALVGRWSLRSKRIQRNHWGDRAEGVVEALDEAARNLRALVAGARGGAQGVDL